VRRGRKARDLLGPTKTARLPDLRQGSREREVPTVKANLARFTTAVALLASMAMTLGAGMRWF